MDYFNNFLTMHRSPNSPPTNLFYFLLRFLSSLGTVISLRGLSCVSFSGGHLVNIYKNCEQCGWFHAAEWSPPQSHQFSGRGHNLYQLTSGIVIFVIRDVFMITTLVRFPVRTIGRNGHEEVCNIKIHLYNIKYTYKA